LNGKGIREIDREGGMDRVGGLQVSPCSPIDCDVFDTGKNRAKKSGEFILYSVILNGKKTRTISRTCNAFDDGSGDFISNTKNKDT